MDEALIHSGRKGMKWYQHIFEKDSHGKYHIKEENAKVGLEAANKLLSDSKKIEESRSNKKRKKLEKQIEIERRKEMSTITDDELKKRVARLTMEKQYLQLTTTQIETGKSRAKKILDASGAVLAVAGSAVTLLAAMEKYATTTKKVAEGAAKVTG